MFVNSNMQKPPRALQVLAAGADNKDYPKPQKSLNPFKESVDRVYFKRS